MAKRTTARVDDYEFASISKLVAPELDATVPVVKLRTQDSLLSNQNERPFETRNL